MESDGWRRVGVSVGVEECRKCLDETVVGHLLQFTCMFMRRGVICCRVTGTRRYCSDSPQGGLEIPCLLFFERKAKEIKKLVKLLSKY